MSTAASTLAEPPGSAPAPQLPRRDFLRLLGIAVASAQLGLAGGYLAGCTKPDGSADTLIYAQGADPRSLDPAYYDDGESLKPACNIYEGLYRYGTFDTTIEPCLASELPQISDDGLTYTIPLRRGVKFHDGTDFNAEAVLASWRRQLAPLLDPGMPYATFVFGEDATGTGLKAVEALDEHTIQLTMRAPSTPFIKNLAMSMAAPIVSPSALTAAGGDLSEAPCGTGPYRFVTWVKSDSVCLTAFDDYWDPARAAKTANLIFKVIPDNTTRLTALLNGEADIIDGVDVSMADQILNTGFTLFAEEGMTVNYMAFNTAEGACADRAVRRAIAQAVNVEELVHSLYGEYATVANSVMPDFMAPYNASIRQAAYDPDAARATLSALGVSRLRCIAYTNPRPYNARGGQALAETIQGYLSQVGVQVDITAYDWTTYRSKLQTDPFDLCFYGWTGDNGDPDNFMNLLADTNWGMNVARFDDAEYKQLVQLGLQTPEGPERDAIYRQCEQLVAERQPWLLISHAKNLCGVSPAVQGFFYHPTGSAFMHGVTKTTD